MRIIDQLPADTGANVLSNPYLMAKTGQLSLMRTTALEEAPPEPQVAEPDQEVPNEQAA